MDSVGRVIPSTFVRIMSCEKVAQNTKHASFSQCQQPFCHVNFKCSFAATFPKNWYRPIETIQLDYDFERNTQNVHCDLAIMTQCRAQCNMLATIDNTLKPCLLTALHTWRSSRTAPEPHLST